MLDGRVAHMTDTVRRDFHRLHWLLAFGLSAPAVGFAETIAARYSESVIVRYRFASALWSNQERGRTADILNALNGQLGDELVQVALKQARFGGSRS